MYTPYHPYNNGKILLSMQVHSFEKWDLAWPKSLHLIVQKITLLDPTGRKCTWLQPSEAIRYGRFVMQDIYALYLFNNFKDIFVIFVIYFRAF